MRWVVLGVLICFGQMLIASPLVIAARDQVGETLFYDPSYVGLSFPMGDVDRSQGVCSDVVIRALRDAHGFDLQFEVNKDMRAAFSSYPKNWGLTRPDKNIDHRRVPNLRRFFERRRESLKVGNDPSVYQLGDIVSWILPGNLTHIWVVSDRRNRWACFAKRSNVSVT